MPRQNSREISYAYDLYCLDITIYRLFTEIKLPRNSFLMAKLSKIASARAIALYCTIFASTTPMDSYWQIFIAIAWPHKKNKNKIVLMTIKVSSVI